MAAVVFPHTDLTRVTSKRTFAVVKRSVLVDSRVLYQVLFIMLFIFELGSNVLPSSKTETDRRTLVEHLGERVDLPDREGSCSSRGVGLKSMCFELASSCPAITSGRDE